MVVLFTCGVVVHFILLAPGFYGLAVLCVACTWLLWLSRALRCAAEPCVAGLCVAVLLEPGVAGAKLCATIDAFLHAGIFAHTFLVSDVRVVLLFTH